jgi:hypothetical protein
MEQPPGLACIGVLQHSARTCRQLPFRMLSDVFIVPGKGNSFKTMVLWGLNCQLLTVPSQYNLHDGTSGFERHLSTCNTTVDSSPARIEHHPLTVDSLFSDCNNATASECYHGVQKNQNFGNCAQRCVMTLRIVMDL